MALHRKSTVLAAGLLALTLALGIQAFDASPSAEAATITVDDGETGFVVNGKCSIQEAVENAVDDASTNPDCPAGSGADKIELPVNSSFVLDEGVFFNEDCGDDPNRFPIIDSVVTINGRNSTLEVIQNEKGPVRAFCVATGGELYLDDLSITGGEADFGGAIFVDGYPSNGGGGSVAGPVPPGGHLELRDTQFFGNAGFWGGVIFADGGVAGAEPGATVDIFDSEFFDNDADFGGVLGLNGGFSGSALGSDTYVGGSAFYRNEALEGGVVWAEGGTFDSSLGADLDIYHSDMTNNTASEECGAFNMSGGNIDTSAGSTLYMEHVWVERNTADLAVGGGCVDGGAFDSSGGATAEIHYSHFTQNNSGTHVGGLWVGPGRFDDAGGGFAELVSTDVIANTTPGFGGGIMVDGGGIFDEDLLAGPTVAPLKSGLAGKDPSPSFNGGDILVRDSTIDGNEAERGGGIYIAGAYIYEAPAEKKGNSIAGGNPFGGGSDIQHSTISNNSAVLGGGIYLEGAAHGPIFGQEEAQGDAAGFTLRGAAMDMGNSTVSGNSATLDGGGVFAGAGAAPGHLGATFNIEFSTITDNSAGDIFKLIADPAGAAAGPGAGVHLEQVSILGEGSVAGTADSVGQFSGTIVAAQRDGGQDCGGGGAVVDGGYNLESEDTCNFSFLPFTSPKLGPLALNPPGTTATHAPLPSSRAIDQVPSGIIDCDEDFVDDQRHVARPEKLYCDIGAYEVGGGSSAVECYTVLDRTRPRFDRTEVYLNDQWTNAEFRVRRPDLYCTPVEKFELKEFVEELSAGDGSVATDNPFPRMNCYDIRRAPNFSSFERRIEFVNNQFGQQLLRVTHEEMLCVNAFKFDENLPGSLGSEQFNTDWKCYRVKELNTPREVERIIYDQFGQRNIIVEEVIRICNEAEKESNEKSLQGGREEPLFGATLVCFDSSDADDQERLPRDTIEVDDQFGNLDLRVVRPWALCVPSDKLDD